MARCVDADLAGTPRPTFTYSDKGSLATIGRLEGCGRHQPELQFGGYFASLIWWVAHIWSLVDFRSKLRAMSG